MNGRPIKLSGMDVSVLRRMAEAYMSTQDLGGHQPGVLPTAADERWQRALADYNRAEMIRNEKQHNVDVAMLDLGPELDFKLLGPLIDPGAALEQLEKEEHEHGKRRHLRRSSRK